MTAADDGKGCGTIEASTAKLDGNLFATRVDAVGIGFALQRYEPRKSVFGLEDDMDIR